MSAKNPYTLRQRAADAEESSIQKDVVIHDLRKDLAALRAELADKPAAPPSPADLHAAIMALHPKLTAPNDSYAVGFYNALDAAAALVAATEVSRAQDTEANAPWLTLAHIICADAGIPPGYITERLNKLRYMLEASRAQVVAGDSVDGPEFRNHMSVVCWNYSESSSKVCETHLVALIAHIDAWHAAGVAAARRAKSS